MGIKFEKIKQGMRLYDVKKNTGITRNKWNIWPVDIISINQEKRTVVASWNGNKERMMTENAAIKLRAKAPINKERW